MDDPFVEKKCEICEEKSDSKPLCLNCHFGLSEDGLRLSEEGLGKSLGGLIKKCGKCERWKEDDKELCYYCWLKTITELIDYTKRNPKSKITAQLNNGKPENIRNCSNCKEELTVECKINDYPETFSFYRCPKCGHENEWWILSGMDKYTIQHNHLPDCYIESMMRAMFLDSFLQNKKISCDQVTQLIKEKYKEENKKEIEYESSEDFNRLFERILRKKNIWADRDFPFTMKIADDNTLEDFFNKRIIRQWDLKHLTTNLNELKEKIKSNEKIKYKDRWLKAIDYFIDLKI